MTRPLAGVRVVEVAGWVFVPAAGAVLADWGAEVIKVEPPGGDPQRGLVYGRHHNEVDFLVQQPNRGKRSIAIDLTTESGREVLGRLVARSDVFLTSFLPAVRARLGIDVDDIRAHRPDIVYARGSGQGSCGPEASAPGFDGTSYWSRGGLAHSLTPAGSSEPAQATAALGDLQAGLNLAGGVAAALVQRSRTGQGSVVDVSLLATALWSLSVVLSGIEAHGLDDMNVPPRSASGNPLTVSYRTRDGRHVKLSLLDSDRFWPELCERVGRPDLAADERFVDSSTRAANSNALVEVLDDVFASADLAAWRERLAGFRGAWAVVQSPREVLSDPQVLANDYVTTVPLDGGRGDVTLVRSPVQFDQEPPVLERAPSPAEHTEEILTELDYDWATISRLLVDGAVA